MEVPLTECIRTPPPSPKGIYAHGPKEGCKDPYFLCFDKRNAAKLWMWVSAMIDWAQDQMKRCGPLPKWERTGAAYYPPDAGAR